MNAVLAFAAGAATTALATALLVRVARALGFVDDPAAAPERKLQRAGVPPVGGPAILCGLVVARLIGGAPLGGGWALFAPAAPAASDERWWWAALAMGFATGLVDDVVPRGLPPGAKLVGQALAGVLLSFALSAWLGDGWGGRALCVGLALLVQNLVNTWDNADGAATASGLVGLAAAQPGAAGALAAFLPFNLLARRADGEPRAYLGDSGSHLVGLVLLAAPWSWPALVPCALDLARVAWARARAGIPIWRGDRRHLAHRLQEAGLAPRAVLLVLVCVSVPALVPAWLWQAAGSAPRLDAALVAGLAAGLAAYALCVAGTLEPLRRGARGGS